MGLKRTKGVERLTVFVQIIVVCINLFIGVAGAVNVIENGDLRFVHDHGVHGDGKFFRCLTGQHILRVIVLQGGLQAGVEAYRLD